MSPQRQKQRTLEVLGAWVLEETERKAVLAVWEDLHWVDPSTLELLSLFLDQVATAPILTLLICRPEFSPPWGTRSPMTHITLSRLGRTHVREMVGWMTGGKILPTEVVQQVKAELLYQRGLPPQALYIFKHALIQQEAYESLLKSKRQQYHQRIAQVLEERFSETVETQPELLAHHYTEAGLNEQAISYWQRAGERARQRSANLEAIGHLTKGLELLKTLPDTRERIQQELTLQIALGAPLIAMKGWGAPECGEVYARAHELCRQVGETAQLFPVLWGLFAFYLLKGELQKARELGEELLSVAQRMNDPGLLVEAHLALGCTLVYLGAFTPARELLQRGIALYDPQQHRSHAFLYGQDPGVGCRIFAAWALWFLGYPEQAVKQSQEALTLAQELSHPYSLVWALNFIARLHQCRREGLITQDRADTAIALCTEQGFGLYLAGGTILRGWVLATQGQGTEGVAEMRRGLAAWRATGAELTVPYSLALLAEGYGAIGETYEGLTVVAEALATARRTGDRFYEAELYRLNGEFLLMQAVSAEQEAETRFRQALDIARRQQAKALELRAAMSLARLWQQQGKRTEAYDLLTPIYGWFAEGFDTADLQEAKALLEELS
jgi:predicted ATPase